ncbi:extracellular alkaline serine protease [Colletotrichum higginsianum]|nr:extracellular alkaline serine protease [Colletotrichum higginsianum]
MTSEDWFKMVDSLNLVLSVDSENNDYQKIRVAVLDTGITPKAAEGFDIQDRMYRDFTDCPDENMRDDTGHGTSVVDLVYKMCEPAEVYVARVMEKSHATTNSVDATIGALEWAMRNNVDIICMAIGFATEVPELKSVLKKAFAANILVFAAASNHNNMSGVMYPARWNECVFSVFSTNAGAKNSRKINPTGSGKYENFAILGEDIKVFTGETQKGTSYSTAIACGLAARLLDFAKQNPVAGGTYGNLCNDLKEKAGMAKVLCGISEKDEEYHCIAPWKLLPENLRWQSDDPSEEEIQRARVSVMNRIAHYLEKF